MTKKIKILPAHRPKIDSIAKGATWDSMKVTLPDGRIVRGYVDTTWGMYIYFYVDGKWKKVSVSDADPHQWNVDLRQK